MIVAAYFYFNLFYVNILEFTHLDFVSQCFNDLRLCVYWSYICLNTRCVSGSHGGRKRALYPQGLELGMAVGYSTGPGNRTSVLCLTGPNTANMALVGFAPFHSLSLTKALDYVCKAGPQGPFSYLATGSFLRLNTKVHQSKLIIWPHWLTCPIRA